MPKHISIPIKSTIELLNVTPYNPLISHCDIKVCYVSDDQNRNGSVINKETGIKIAASLPGCPIVGFYNEEKKDFVGHQRSIEVGDGKFRIRDLTRPYGYVDSTAKIWFQKFLDDGIEHEYLMTEGFLWTSIYEEAKEVIKKGKNQSMELDNDSVKGSWAYDNNGSPTFFIINDALIQKLCILGDDVEPCFEGAGIAAQFSLDDDFKQTMYSFMEDIKQALNKGGLNPMPDENNKLDQNLLDNPENEFKKKPDEDDEDKKKNNPPTDDDQEDNEDNDDENDNEDEKKKKPSAKHSLKVEDQPEYIDLLNKFNALSAEAENLKTSYANLEEEVKGLRQFKLESERKEKEDMINNTFYMLSATDKADVIANIDSYSLDQIEAKLSIICVRNKVNFNLDNDNNKNEGDKPNNPMITYQLDGTEDGDTAPAWIKAVRETAKNL